MAILEAYRVKNRVPPPGIKAHSTRAVGASWAVHHRASALQLCKAATWSSIHTFAKFYKVHTYASADASLGRRILQAAVPPSGSSIHPWFLCPPMEASRNRFYGLEILRSFQNQIAAIQRDAVWWLHTVVPSISKLSPKDYVHCLHKVLFTEQPETYYKWDNWPPESDRNFFLRLCSEVPLLEDTLMRILVIGLSRDLPLGPADAMELADHLVKRAAAVQADDLEVLKIERIQLLDAVLNLCTYHHPENIQLPPGYDLGFS
ncbi:unnamed protein product [Ranitomeya imitator]|uniref:Uncharacterized protein n=1 Tax=Ranitomeya imitator TaxID=111125 RepID=A0ABN9MKY9_9NEOB|nr:unnamed protein product [Ranitomeya imitator]